MAVTLNDPRLLSPQCRTLAPVRTVHQNPWFSVRERGGYYTIEHHQTQVVIVPLVEPSKIVMVYQDRPILADRTLEFPAGGVESGENPTQAAARELFEETGIAVHDLGRFRPMASMAITPRDPLLPFIFCVELTEWEVEGRVELRNETDEVEILTEERIREKVDSGEIYLGLHIGILFKLDQLGHFRRNRI
ncbi:MAG: NUDIX hydrolase [Pseudomonadota bacterium]